MPLLAIVAGALTVAACDIEGYSPVDGSMAGVIVYGYVSDHNDAPVPGASVDVIARGSSCSSTTVRAQDSDLTTTTGRYRVILQNWGDSMQVCVRVIAHPTAISSNLETDSAQLASVMMRSTVVDSVRIDVRLSP